MTIATVTISMTRPSEDVEWYPSSPEERAYYDSKYSSFTNSVTPVFDPGTEETTEDTKPWSNKKIRKVMGETPLITEYYNELNNPESILYVNRIAHFQANGIQYQITYSED